MCNRKNVDTADTMVRLWVHECQRVFADRFVRTKTQDEQKFKDILVKHLSENLSRDWGSLMHDSLDSKAGPLFCGFLSEPIDENERVVYEEVTSYPKIRSLVEEKLEDYNMEPKLISMDLAMFKDAVMHVCRIHRVLIQPRGNIMLIGVGGSGRSSLTRLSAFIASMSTFTIEIAKNYRLTEFREDLKRLYLTAGCDNKAVCFLFNDTQIKDESFLEDVNNILSSGVVPNLFGKDEVPGKNRFAIYDFLFFQEFLMLFEKVPRPLVWKKFQMLFGTFSLTASVRIYMLFLLCLQSAIIFVIARECIQDW